VTKLYLTGQTFGKLKVLRRAGLDRHGAVLWECSCECGRLVPVRSYCLTRGKTRSCGCARHEQVTTHGMTNTPEYNAWCMMRARCGNPKNNSYHNYGGRGIKVCERWASSFESFLADVGRKPSPKHSLDREENNGDYEPGNVRWSTRRTQTLNRRPYKMRVLRNFSDSDIREEFLKRRLNL
jgi:hypothetical protein